MKDNKKEELVSFEKRQEVKRNGRWNISRLLKLAARVSSIEEFVDNM